MDITDRQHRRRNKQKPELGRVSYALGCIGQRVCDCLALAAPPTQPPLDVSNEVPNDVSNKVSSSTRTAHNDL